MDSENALFAPLEVGRYRLPNRIVMAPMGRARSEAHRGPKPIVPVYYAQRASAGLLITEGTHVSPHSVTRPGTSAIHSETQLEAWRAVPVAVHAAGGLIFQQLYHAGRKQHRSALPDTIAPVAPSAIAAKGSVQTANGIEPFSMPRALELHEIPALVDEFRAAAVNSLKAGFDGVEVHGANAYLIDQFLRDATNLRTDDYGGSIENRARFLLAVVDACIGVFGADRVGVRLSPHPHTDGIADSNPLALTSYVAEALDRRKVAYLHLIEGPLPYGPGDGYAPLRHAARKAFRGPLMLSGGYTKPTATAAIAGGEADLISFGALFIANPDLPERFRRNAPLNPPDKTTFYDGGDARGYIDYPTLEPTGG